MLSDTSLRSRGSKDSLDVRGKFTTQLMTVKGAVKITMVYVVDGQGMIKL